MAKDNIDFFVDRLNEVGDKALLDAKYLRLTPDDVITAYQIAGLPSPVLYIKNTWLRGLDHGWGNGYVRISPNHSYYDKGYDDIPVDVHGGLTFSEHMIDDKKEVFSDGFWVGFDTAHHSDNQQNWPKSLVIKETKDLLKQVYDLV